MWLKYTVFDSAIIKQLLSGKKSFSKSATTNLFIHGKRVKKRSVRFLSPVPPQP